MIMRRAVREVSSLPCLDPQALRRVSIQTAFGLVALATSSALSMGVGTAFVHSANLARSEPYRVPANLHCLPRVQLMNST
jgi:hypothetical protein